jgi:hypothetical protein
MLEVPSRIEAVTVYRRGARVRRVIAVEAGEEGFPAAVLVGGLPLALDDGSVRVSVLAGGEGAPPVATSARVQLDPGRAPAARPPDEEAILLARGEEAAREADVAQLEAERGRLDALQLLPRQPPSADAAPVEVPIEARYALITERSRRLLEIQGELREARAALEQARKRRRDLEARRAGATSARQVREHELRKAVVVGLEAGTAARATVALEYQVPGARGTPAYVLKLDPDLRRAVLQVRAQVAQRTGEDWEGVTLSLSTAAAQSWTELPELKALRIGRARPAPPRRGFRPPPTGADALYSDYDRAVARLAEAGQLHLDGDEPDDMEEEWAGAPPEPEPELDAPPPGSFSIPEARSAPAPSGAPMPAMAPPAPQMAASARRSAGLFGAIGGLAAGAADIFRDEDDGAAMPAPPMSRGGGGGAREAKTRALVPRRPPEPAHLLDYGRLRLAGPGEPGRGQLRPTDPAALYLEVLAVQQVEISVSVRQVLAVAVSLAGECDSAALPPGHREPAAAGGFDFSWQAAHPADLPSDGGWHNLPLSERDAAPAPRYVVVPREAREVFRTVSVENPLQAPLLAGPVDVYVGGDYLMTSPLETTPIGGAFVLGLGVEQAIKCARNTRYSEETAGLLRGTMELRHEIRVELESHLPGPAVVEVRERLPVAREGDDDVKVESTAVEPPWEPLELEGQAPVEGAHRWEVTVPPGEKRLLRAAYTVRIPGRHELVGGNRRER